MSEMTVWGEPSVVNLLGARPVASLHWAACLEARHVSEGLLISGWVLSDYAAVRALEVWHDGRLLTEVAPHLESLDVAGVYPLQPWATRCRLALALPLPADTPRAFILALNAQVETGQRMHVATVVCRPIGGPGRRLFVVGSPRSGTTVVGNSLRKVLGLPNYGEAHVLPLLHEQVATLDKHLDAPQSRLLTASPENLLTHLPAVELRERLAEGLRCMYRGLHGGDSFCDKTPGVPMLRALPLAASVWPDARFIFCRRHGLENVASRLRKFSDVSDFEGHCRDWAMAMQVWLEVRDALPTGAWFELDQQVLERDPAGMGQRLGAWLGLDDAQRDALAGHLGSLRPEQTRATPSATPATPASLGWSLAQTALFAQLCGPMMAAYGYAVEDDGAPA